MTNNKRLPTSPKNGFSTAFSADAGDKTIHPSPTLSSTPGLKSVNRTQKDINQFADQPRPIIFISNLRKLVSDFFALKQPTLSQAESLLENYLLALEQSGCSSSTSRNYRSDIKQFIAFAKEKSLKNLITKPKLQEFSFSQAKKGLKSTSIYRKLSSIIQFGLWAQDKGHVSGIGQDWLGQITREMLAQKLSPDSSNSFQRKKLDKNLVYNSPDQEIIKSDPDSLGGSPENYQTQANNQAKNALDIYLQDLEHMGASASTIRNYRSDFIQLQEFADETNLEVILQEPVLKAFIAFQQEKGLKSASIARKLSSITQFGLWAKKRGLAPDVDQNWPTNLLKQEFDDSGSILEKSKMLDSLTSKPNIPPVTNNQVNQNKLGSLLKRIFTPSRVIYPNPRLMENKNILGSNFRLNQNEAASVFSRPDIADKTYSLLPWLNFAALLLFVSGLGYLGYKQFQQAKSSLAYPTTLTRPNRILSFQGRLTDTGQNPITTSTNMRYRLYDAATDGTQLWDSNTCAVDPDQDGIFAVSLGAGAGAGADDDDCGAEISQSVFSENANVWLEVQIASETLTPRQPIRTVAYAANSETLQGYPASASAVENTVIIMDNNGEIVLGNANPKIKATGDSFTLEGASLTLQTTSGSNTDITLSAGDDIILDAGGVGGTGAIKAYDFLHAPGATLSANYAGGTALVLKAGPSATGDIMQWQNSSGTALGVIDENGNIGVGTTTPGVKIEVVGGDIRIPTNSYYQMGNALVSLQRIGSVMTLNAYNGWNFYDTQAGQSRVYITQVGNVGIGTTSPSQNLHIQGNARLTGALYDVNNEAGTSGQILSTTATGTDWIDASTVGTNYWQRALGSLAPTNITDDVLVGATATSSAIVRLPGQTNENAFFNLGTGNLGVGTTSPGAKLQINTGADATIGQIIRANSATQTGNLTEWQNSSGTVLSGTTKNGYLFSHGALSNTNFFAGTQVVGAENISHTTGSEGYYNVALGYRSLYQITTGYANTAVGYNSLYNVTTGNNNLAMGRDAGYNVTGSNNFSLGTSSGQWGAGSTNVAIGNSAASAGSTTVNTYRNVAIGHYTFNSGAGSDNISIGAYSNYSNTSGIRNTTVGSLAAQGTSSYSSNYNVIVGYQAAFNMANASNNNTVVGYLSGYNLTTGDNNILFGNYAGYNQNTASNLLIIDNQQRADTATELTNSILYGVMAATPGSQTLRINAAATIVPDAAAVVPLSIRANASQTANLQEWQNSSGTALSVVNASGNLGIGTTTPSQNLHIQGNARLTGALYDVNNSVGTAGQVLSTTTTGVDWIDASAVGTNYWQRDLGSLAPINITDDLLMGSTATASAIVRLPGQTNENAFFNLGTGNLGVGTTAPGSKLESVNTSAAALTEALRISNNGAGVNTGVSFAFANAGSAQALIKGYYDGEWKMGLGGTSAGNTLTLTRAENVGIGSISPTAKLDIAGSASSSGTLAFRGTTDPKIDILNGENFGIQTSVGGDTGLTERLTILNNGNVGVGTTGPGAKLQINTGADATIGQIIRANSATQTGNLTEWQNSSGTVLSSFDASGKLRVGGADAVDSGYVAKLGTSANAATGLLINNGYTGTAARSQFRIGVDSGYGTIFYHFSTGYTTSGLFAANRGIMDSSGTGGLLLGSSNASGEVSLFTGGIGGSNVRMYINSSGLVSVGNQIGETLPAQFTVNGVADRIQQVIKGYSSQTSDLTQWRNSGNTILSVVNASGNLGIGTTSPTQTLHIQGNARLTGALYDVNNETGTSTQVLSTTGTGVDWVDVNTLTSQYWQRALGSLAPTNITDDVLVGATATSSAIVRLPGQTNENAFFNLGTGNLGVGTTAPAHKLSVNGSGTQTAFGIYADAGHVSLYESDNSNKGWSFGVNAGDFSITESAVASPFVIRDGTATNFLVADGSDFAISGRQIISHGTAADNVATLRIRARASQTQNITEWQNSSGTALSVINASGNLGIGSTAPAQALDIVGNVQFSGALMPGGAAGTSGYVLTSSGTGTAPTWVDSSTLTGAGLWQNTSNVFHPKNEFASIVDLAIGGDSTASARFRVEGSTGNATSSGTLSFRGTTDPKINVLNGENFGIQTSVGGDAGLTERLTILNNGNVGVGTTSPSAGYLFDVNGATKLNGYFYVTSGWTYLNPSIFASSNGFHLVDDKELTFGAYPGDYSMGYNSTDDTLEFVDGTSIGTNVRMVLNSTGNLGIGTTTPSQLLHIQGNARLTGALYDVNNSVGTAGQVLSTTTTGVDWIDASAVGTNYWQRDLGSLAPINITDDLLMGSTATASAIVRLPGQTNENAFFNLGTGNLGVGTTAPTEKLDVRGNITLNGSAGTSTYYLRDTGSNILRIGSTSTTAKVQMELYHATNPVSMGIAYSGGSAFPYIESAHSSYAENTQLLFKPGGTETWRIGSMGSGATLPSSFIIRPVSNNYDFSIQNSSSTSLMLVDSSTGNVGIGTTTPGAKLQINTGADAAIGQIIRANSATQTGNLQEWQNSSGTALSSISAYGTLGIGAQADQYVGAYVSYATNRSGGSVYGIQNQLTVNNTTTYGTAGFYRYISSGTFTTNTGWGIQTYGTLRTGLTMTSFNAVDAQIDVNSGATVSNYRLYYGGSGTLAGSVTNYYGLHLENISGATNNYAILTNAGNIVFNEGGDASTTLRVEGDTDANLLYTDAANNRVGIGTSSPTMKLHVVTGNSDGIRISSSNTAYMIMSDLAGGADAKNYGYYAGSNTFAFRLFDDALSGTTDWLSMTRNGTSVSSIVMPTGNVGIGTTTPTAKLDIAGVASSSATLAFRGTTDPKINILNGENLGIQTSVGGDAGLAERLTILNNGNIGIGSTSPTEIVDIVGNLKFSAALMPNNDAGTSGYVLTSAGAGSPPTWTHSTNLVGVLWQNTDNVYHPKYEYAEVADLVIGGTSTASANIHLRSDGQAYFSGNVGIGSASPGYRLDVVGDSLFDGNFYLDSDTGTNGLYVTRLGAATESLKIHTTDTDVVMLSEQNEDTGLSGGFVFQMDNDGTAVPTFTIEKKDGSDLFIVDSAQVAYAKVFTDIVNPSYYFLEPAAANSLYTAGNVGLGMSAVSVANARLHVSNGDSGTVSYHSYEGQVIENDNNSKLEFITPNTFSQGIIFSDADSLERGHVLYNHSTDLLSLRAGGTTTMYLGGGNVGIGTTTMTALLDIAGSASSSATLAFRGTTDPKIDILNGENLGIRTSVGGDAGLTERFTILNNGNVGIGSTSPSNALTINHTTAPQIKFGYDSDSYGTLGVDSSNQLSLRALNGSIVLNPDGADLGLIFKMDNEYLTTRLHDASNNYEYFFAENGNVGIGTTTMTALLDIAGSASSSGTLTFRGTTDPKVEVLNGENFGIRTSVGGGAGLTERLTILNNGNVGIGSTTPANALDVVGKVQMYPSGVTPDNNYAGTLHITQAAASGQYINFVRQGQYPWSIGTVYNASTFAIGHGNATDSNFTSSEVYLSIAAGSGNVGIGTTSASEKLHVVGSARISTLAGTGNRTVYSDANGTLTNSSSDINLKKNIENISDSVDVITALKQLRGVYYNWRTDIEAVQNLGDQREIGMIAQEVEAILPELVGTNSTGYKSLDYSKFTGFLVEVSKAQQNELEILASGISGLSISSTGAITVNYPTTTNQDQLDDLGMADATTEVTTANYQLYNAEGNPVVRIAEFADIAAAKIKAGLIQAKNLLADNIIAQTIRSRRASTSVIEPNTDISDTLTIAGNTKVEGSLEISGPATIAGQLDSTSIRVQQLTALSAELENTQLGQAQINQAQIATATISGKLQVSGTSRLGALLADTAELNQATITQANVDQANITTAQINTATIQTASISGQLTAANGRLDYLETQVAQLESIQAQTAEIVNATVSGTLYAHVIDGFEDRVAQAFKQPSLLGTLIGENPVDPLADFTLTASSSADTDLKLADLSLEEDDVVITPSAAYIEQYLRVNGNGYLVGDLGVGKKVMIGNGLTISEGYISYAPTDVASPLFQIQPNGQGTLSLMAGLLTISDTGLIEINGSLKVAGALDVAGDVNVRDTLLTNLIAPLHDDQPVQLQLARTATDSGEVKESRFEIVDELGAPVATISASGKAEFAGGVGVTTEDITNTASGSAEFTAQQTAGRATIVAGQTEITIKSELIKEDTLIYVTPLGSTMNQVLYVKTQTAENPDTSDKEGQFQVGFDEAITRTTDFNWWLVN
ncbi:MAG: site-specific integrase [Patescibacteria group bacterium]